MPESITGTTSFQRLNQVLDHARGRDHIKNRDDDSLQWKVGYSSIAGKIKYSKLSDAPRYDRDGDQTTSERTVHNKDTIINLSNVFASSANQLMRTQIGELYEHYRKDGQEHPQGVLSEDSEFEQTKDLSEKLIETVRGRVMGLLGLEDQYVGVGRVRVRDVKALIPEIDKIVQDTVQDFVERFDPDQGLIDDTKKSVQTLVEPNVRGRMDDVISELKNRGGV